MEIKNKIISFTEKIKGAINFFKSMLITDVDGSNKSEINFKAFKVLMLISILVFVIVIFLLPNDTPVEFSKKMDHSASGTDQKNSDDAKSKVSHANALWATPKMNLHGASAQPNYNTPMLVGMKGGNAKTELRAGIRLPLKFLDKVIVSQESVPILAELILDSQTDSGLKIPAGTKFYGQASFEKGSERATVRFTQISLPSGQMKKITAMALDKDGQPGVVGRVFSDGMKNTAGQVLTTFVGGLAAGSMETDFLGHSKGGIENGLLSAVATTGQTRAQNYGEKLKAEREWIELNAGLECDAVLNESLKLQEGGDNYEQ